MTEISEEALKGGFPAPYLDTMRPSTTKTRTSNPKVIVIMGGNEPLGQSINPAHLELSIALCNELKRKKHNTTFIPWSIVKDESEPRQVAMFLKVADERKNRNNNLIISGFPESVDALSDLHNELETYPDLPQEVLVLHLSSTPPAVKAIETEYAKELFGLQSAATIAYDKRDSVMLLKALVVLAGYDPAITICGPARSGKSTIAEGMEAYFGYPKFSAGDHVARPMAEEMKMSLEDLLELIKDPDERHRIQYDEKIDEWIQTEFMNKHKFVLDARLGAHWLSGNVCKVLIKVTDEEAGNRELAYRKKRNLPLMSAEQSIAFVRERNAKDDARYKDEYEFDLHDESHYDIVIDSTHISKEKILKAFIDAYTTCMVRRMFDDSSCVC